MQACSNQAVQNADTAVGKFITIKVLCERMFYATKLLLNALLSFEVDQKVIG
jgi:hypothetical protein